MNTLQNMFPDMYARRRAMMSQGGEASAPGYSMAQPMGEQPMPMANLGLGSSPMVQQPGLNAGAYPQMVTAMQQDPTMALQGGLLQQEPQPGMGQGMGGLNKGLLAQVLMQYGMQGLR